MGVPHDQWKTNPFLVWPISAFVPDCTICFNCFVALPQVNEMRAFWAFQQPSQFHQHQVGGCESVSREPNGEGNPL